MKENKKLVYIILIIVILILLAINLKIFMNNYIGKSNSDNQIKSNAITQKTSNIVSNDQDDKNREEKIATLSEKNRMQTYFGRYISYIETKDYQNAYNLLYEEFKKTYFPTLNDFEKYVIEKYPNNMVINYKDISREGKIYILKLQIKDALTSNINEEGKEIQVVIMEEDLNNFKISFEVI